MKNLHFLLIFLLIPVFLFSQKRTVEIFGKITGESKQKIYLFFENDFAHGNSMRAEIKNGKFYFKSSAALPVLCRFHFGENSQIQELYIDNSKTFITFSSKLSNKDIPDSLGGRSTMFEIADISGSETENIIRSFQNWYPTLKKTKLTDEQRHKIYYTKLKTLVIKYPKSKASAYLIAEAMYFRGRSFSIGGDLILTYDETNDLTHLLDTSLMSAMEGENLLMLLSRLDIRRHRAIGNTFNHVILKDTSNNDIDTKIYSNKYVLIDCWASWCKPCRALNPELKILYEKYKDKGFEIIGMSVDRQKEAWKKAIIQDSLQWPQLNDNNGTDGLLCKFYDIESIPTKILIDKKGIVVGFNLSTAEIENILKKEL